jgi:hypothetical protein
MLKNILNLNGAQELSKNSQLSILGGDPQVDCEMNGGRWVCVGTQNCGCVYDIKPGPNHK